MIKEAIAQLITGHDLSLETARSVMDEIMTGRATNAQMAAFLTAMRMKGESIDENHGLCHGDAGALHQADP